MKSLMKHAWITALLAVALLVAPLTKAVAQGSGEFKPIAVISVANVDKLLGDIDYLAKTGGAADAARTLTFIIGPYLAGIDRTKPSGAYVTLDGDEPVVVGFIPTKDLTLLLASIKDTVGEAKDAGDGVQQVGEGEASVFVKQEGSFAFIARDTRHLTGLPKDPVALLGGLDKTYSIAAKLSMQNIPQSLKDQMIDGMKQGFDAAPIEAEDPAQRELAEKLGRNSLNQMIALVEETNEITFGWAVEPKAKTTYVDMVFTAIPGTKLAKDMAQLKAAKTNFAGFLLDDAAFTMNLSSQTTDKDQIAQAIALLESMRETAMKELDKEGTGEDEKAAAKDLLTTVMDVAKKTVESGLVDGGAVALLDAKEGAKELTVVAGGQVVDAPKLEAALKKAVKFAQEKNPDEFKDIEVAFDVATHGGVRFHSIKGPAPDDQAREIFGEKINLLIGAGDKSVYIAFGTKAEETLKKVIDKSAANLGKAVPPMQANLAIGPLLKFGAAVESNPVADLLAEAADKVKGNDHIKIHVTAVDNGEKIRFEIEEGVIQLIGEGAKAATGAGGAPPAF